MKNHESPLRAGASRGLGHSCIVRSIASRRWGDSSLFFAATRRTFTGIRSSGAKKRKIASHARFGERVGSLDGPHMSSGLSVSVAVPSESARIELLRDAVGRIAAAAWGAARGEALAMVTWELLENAVKYGRSRSDPVTLAIEEHDDRVVVSVGNAVDEASRQVISLEQQLTWLGGFADPAEAYLAALQRVYDQPDASPRLGLARVAYEGGCSVTYAIERPGWLVVRAARRFVDAIDTGHASDPDPSNEGARDTLDQVG